MNLKKGDLLELDISDYAFEGKGVSKVLLDDSEEKRSYVIFVHNGYPGDRVLAKLIKVKKSYSEAAVEKIIIPSKDRAEPRCMYFGYCGGCKQQDLGYGLQLHYKEKQVKDIFSKLGKFENYESLPIIPSVDVYHYRNKMEFSFSDQRWLLPGEINAESEIIDKNFALGLHVPKNFEKVLDIDECWLQSSESNEILNATRDFFKTKGSSIYSTKTHEGYLRNLVIRNSKHYGDFMVNLVTSKADDNLMRKYTEQITERFPFVTTIINNVNYKKSQVALGDEEIIYYGPGFIMDSIGGYNYRISANSFFQTNTAQAGRLYDAVLDLGFRGEKRGVVYDLYSGAGTIALYVSKHSEKVYAFESNDSAMDDALLNSKLNSVENVSFIKADLNKSFLPIKESSNIPDPELIIVDPPRSGMHPNTVKDLLALKPPKIVYVSCNPATQARDMAILCENRYELEKIQPVDMFPNTFHIENVALLKLVK